MAELLGSPEPIQGTRSEFMTLQSSDKHFKSMSHLLGPSTKSGSLALQGPGEPLGMTLAPS